MSVTDSQVLTTQEVRLNKLEEVIQKGKWAFVAVGVALYEVKALKLYEFKHANWNDYCKNRWGFKKAYADQLIQSADAVGKLPKDAATMVCNQRQGRAIAGVPESDRVQVLEAASKQAESEGRDMTARDITNAASEQDPPVDIESTVMESKPATPTDTAPAPEPAPAPAEPRVWPEAEFKKTVTIILTEYQHEGGAVELTRSAQFLRDWAKSIEKHAKWLTAQGVKI